MTDRPTSNADGHGADGNAADRTGRAAGAADSPRRAQLLSELAAEIRAVQAAHRGDVAQLRAELARLGALLGENADLLAQSIPRWAGVDEAVAELGGRVDALTAATAGPAGPAGPAAGARPVDWSSLSAADAAAEWEAIASWIANVLGPVYEFTRGQLPDCWPLHTPAVAELVWLRRCYVAAHRPDAPPTAAGEWHTRWRRDALANIATIIDHNWCRPGEHYIDRYDQRRPRDTTPTRPREQHVHGQRPESLSREDQITEPRHWADAYQTAAAADLARRRQREAADANARPSTS